MLNMMTTVRKLGNIYGPVISNVGKKYFPHRKINVWLQYLPLGLCLANDNIKKIEIQTPKTLTHEYLIKQATSVTVSAATQLLTQTVVAILDTAEEYKKALLNLLSLLQESKELLGNNEIQQDLADLIIASRAKVNDVKTQLIELDTLLNYVEKVVVSTAETSFLAGDEFLSTSLSERLYTSKLQIDETLRSIKALENDFLSLQKEVIFETSEFEKKTKTN